MTMFARLQLACALRLVPTLLLLAQLALVHQVDANTQTISWTGTTNAILAIGTEYPISATSSSGLPVTLRVESGPAVIEAGSLRVTALGAVTVTATQTGDLVYQPATQTRTFNVPHVVLRHVMTLLSGALDIKISGKYAYVAAAGADAGLVILDVSNPAAPVRMGRAAMVRPYTLAIAGNYAYVISDDGQKMQVVDISDSANPQLKGSSAIGGTAFRIAAQGNYVYILADPGYNAHLKVMDVSNPLNPAIVATESLWLPQDLAFVGSNFLFIGGHQGFGSVAYDVSDPRKPAYRGNGFGDTTAMVAAGNYLFRVANNSFWIMDASAIFPPPTAGQLDVVLASGQFHEFSGMALEGSLAYLVRNGGIDVIDFSDRTHPFLTGANDLGLTPFALQAIDKYVYAAGPRGVEVFDMRYAYDQEITLTAPATDFIGLNEPAPLLATSTSGLPVSFEVTGPGKIVDGQLVATAPGTIMIQATQSGDETYTAAYKTLMYNVRQAAVSLLGQYSDPTTVLDFALSGNSLYAACGEQGLRVFDVTDPALPKLIGKYPAPTDSRKMNAVKIALVGNMAYVLSEQITEPESGDILNNRSFDIFDVTDPAKPALLGSMPPDDPDIFLSSGDPQAIQVVGRLAYIVMGGWLWIVDVSNPVAPALVYRFDQSDVYTSQIAGNLLYLAAQDGLYIFDVSTPEQPRQIAFSDPLWPESHAPIEMRVGGQTVFLLTRGALLTLQGDPTNLMLVGSASTDSFATGLDVSGSYFFVSERSYTSGAESPLHLGGVEVFDATNPARIIRVGGFRNSDSAYKVQAFGDVAYLGGNGTAPLKVLKSTFQQPGEPYVEISAPRLLISRGSTFSGSILSAPSVPGARWQFQVSYSLTHSDVLSPDPAEWHDFNPTFDEESAGIQRFHVVLDSAYEAQFFRLRKVEF